MKYDPVGIVQETDIWPRWYLVLHKTQFVLENKTLKILWNSILQTNYLISGRRFYQMLYNKNFNLVDFGVQ